MFVFLCLSLCTGLPVLSAACPALCSCFFHKLSDGSKARSVLCSDPKLTSIPTNFPSDVSKLQIEKTDIAQISSEAFISLRNLEFLWMSFNSFSVVRVDSFRGLSVLSELRLEGNFIDSFPWESLADMPSLRLLDLHNNRISSIPSEAAVYIRNLTYLDLSSNSLTTVPSEVLLMWFSAKLPREPENKMILGLHDNPWQCDCRLFDLVQFQKTPSSTSTFIDTHLRCSEPESFSGVLFPDVEIQRCEVPRVHTAVARVRSLVGDNVLLRCGTVGVPIPRLTWSRADEKAINGTVHEEDLAEGITWSVLSIISAAPVDSGKYVCKATNFVGSTNAMISLIVSEKRQLSEAAVKKTGTKKNDQAANQEKLIARYISSTSSSEDIIRTFDSNFTGSSKMESYSTSYRGLDGNPSVNSLEMDVDKDLLSNLAANASSLQRGPEKRVVRSVKVIGDTDHTVLINWRAPSATNTTWFSVLYAVFGERDMRRIDVGPGKHRMTIEGLVPKTKYITCVCVKGLIPKKEQCVIFSTDEAASASGTQKLINVVVITVACVIAVPLTLIVCCGALKRRLQKLMRRKSKDVQESYVTFETLTPGGKAKGMEGEYLRRLNQDESNRLLSARSSVDSEAVNKTEGNPNEYYC